MTGEPLEPLDHGLPTQLVFGVDAIDRLGAYAEELAAQRVFVVTDPGVVAAGHAQRGIDSLRASGLEVQCFDAVGPNPTTDDVAACLAALADFDLDLWVGLGGGSSLDVAKGGNLLRAGGGRIEDYWGVGKARGTLLPMIAVPTTAGTGSEMQSFALIGQADGQQKMACGDPGLAPRLALLDPGLTLTQPRRVTACAGLDAIGHAVETLVTSKRSAVSARFSSAAFALGHRHLPQVLEHPGDLDARGGMLQAAAYAGIAIEHSMLGAAHATANPLTSQCGFVHGHAVGLMLPHVVRFNAELAEVRRIYAGLARQEGLAAAGSSDAEASEALARALAALLAASALPGRLSELGVAPGQYPGLAEAAAAQWTAQFNPRPVVAADFQTLLGMAS